MKLVVQEAVYAFAVVEDHRPIRDQKVVVLRANDKPAFLGLVVDEVLQRLAEDVGSVNLFVPVATHEFDVLIKWDNELSGGTACTGRRFLPAFFFYCAR